MEKWLELDSVQAVLPKGCFGEAVAYLRNHWDALRHYLTDGKIPIDNNHSERAIRLLTIGRKNWLISPLLMSLLPDRLAATHPHHLQHVQHVQHEHLA
jgi:hypothetical protein